MRREQPFSLVFQAAGLAVAATCIACGGSSPTSPTATPSISPSPAPSTPATITLTGLVRNDIGDVLPGTLVTVTEGAQAGRTTTSDRTGAYELSGLTPGGLTIVATLSGHTNQTQSMNITQSRTLDLVLMRARMALTGSWTGTYAHTDRQTRQRRTLLAAAVVTQTGDTVSGTLRIGSPTDLDDAWLGSFSGTLSSPLAPAQYAGSLTLNALISTGSGRCNGTRNNVTGTITGSQITLSAPGPWTWAECISGTEDIAVVLRR